MKGILLMILNLLVYHNIFSQEKPLKANAGKDKSVCFREFNMDTITLGGNPSATGGVGNYTYCWETKVKIAETSKLTFYASSYLDDTTSPNPKVINDPFGYKLGLKLTITDSLGNSDMDSVYVYFSRFSEIIGNNIAFISKGDSVLLDGSDVLYSPFPIDSVSWIPETGLADPHALYTYSKPEEYIFYRVYIRDTAGCSITSGAGYEVYVYVLGTKIQQNCPPAIYYNNSSGCLVLNNFNFSGENNFVLHVYAADGKLLFEHNIDSDMLPFSCNKPQVLFYTITSGDIIQSSGQLLINKY